VLPADVGIGQSSSVMLDQNTQIMMTESRVKRVEKKPPLMAPFEPLQMCTLITYWKIWLMAKRRPAAVRYTVLLSVKFLNNVGSFVRLTHWADFTEHAENQDSFQDEEDHNEDKWHELVKGVESVSPVGRARDSVLPVVGESKSSIKRNVSGADKECSCRAENEANGGNGSVVEYLVADHGVHEQNPEGGHDRSNVNSRETNAHATIEWEPANCEDLTDRNDDVAEEEKLHFSFRKCQPLFVFLELVCMVLLTSYRQQLASCWIAGSGRPQSRSQDPHIVLSLTRCQPCTLLYLKQHDIPKLARLLPPLRLIPSRLQPPKPLPPLEGEPSNRLHTGNVECRLPVSRQKS
jgi:hypothetical protein